MLGDFSTLGAMRPRFQVYWLLPLATFVHEAGHVLACERFGVRIREVGLLFAFSNPALMQTSAKPGRCPDAQISTILSRLCDQGFMLREGDRYLALRRRVPLSRDRTNN
jgi:hypothetical protein